MLPKLKLKTQSTPFKFVLFTLMCGSSVHFSWSVWFQLIIQCSKNGVQRHNFQLSPACCRVRWVSGQKLHQLLNTLALICINGITLYMSDQMLPLSVYKYHIISNIQRERKIQNKIMFFSSLFLLNITSSV